MKEYIEEVQKIIGIKFNEPKLLVTALTHSSYANQHREEEYNERFEFLGDSILQLTITEYLFLNFKDKSEGELTKIRSLIVCENSLYEIGKSLDLGNHLRMSKGEELTGGRERISLIADAVEALIAAIYLDGGYEIARDIALELLSKEIDQTLKGHNVNEDYKTKLQEILQRNGNVKIEYVLLKEYGPEHDKTFEVEVLFNGKKIGEGIGKSKKQAEQNCAKQAIEQLSRN